MRSQKLLLTVATAALIAATGGAYAQQEHRGAGAERAAPQNSAPAGRPSGPAVQNNVNRPSGPIGQGRPETTGQAPRENAAPEKSQERVEQTKPNENGARQNNRNEERANTREREERRNAQQERQERNTQQERQGQNNRENERLNRNNERTTTGQSNERRNDVNGRSETDERSTTTNENRTGGSVNLSVEQRTRIHDVIVGERGAPRVANVNFPVRVGTVVPRDIRLVPLPQTIFEIEPGWRGFEYFLVGDEIVVVNPYDLHIVAVLPA
jgi:hypothetical protein